MRLLARGSLPALLALFPAVVSAQAEKGAASAPSAAAVNAAIERGVEHLLAAQNRDGSWGLDLYERGLPWHDLRDGATALALYTLLKCGLPHDHPSIERGTAFLTLSTPHHTYATGIQLHALGALGIEKHRKRLQELVKVLADLEIPGGFDYPGLNRPDLSNTQVAALGFRAAAKAGIGVPKGIWSSLAEATLRYQERALEIPGTELLPREQRFMAGFAYEPGGRASASMTTAGLTIIGIALEEDGRVPHGVEAKLLEARTLATNWLAQNFSVEGNPGGEEAWHYYYLYGLERVGAFSGQSLIGTHDWYSEGATQLLKEQRADGGWRRDGRTSWPPQPMPIANTCFGLLFLRKATFSPTVARERPGFRAMEEPDSEVWIRLDAKDELTMWVTGFAPAVLERYPPSKEERQAGATVSFVVEAVEWWLDGELVATVEAPPASRTGAAPDLRFAARIPGRGAREHELVARVHALDAGGKELELASKPVRFRHELAREPWMLDYVDDAETNVFRGQELTLSASSEESGFHRPAEAFDGLQGSSWWAREDDPEPWIKLELARGVKVRELLFSPAASSELLREQCAAFETIELRINDGKEVLRVTMEANPLVKTAVKLARPTLVRRLEVRVIGAPRAAGKFVGFAEIEARG